MQPRACPSVAYRQSLPSYRSRKALGDFPKLLPTDGLPKASHDFALELQVGLSRIRSPVLWIKANPDVVVSMTNPCSSRRLEELRTRLPQLEVRDFGPGYHFLTEEDPDRMASMVSSWLTEIGASAAA